jgi:hypothetical protein
MHAPLTASSPGFNSNTWTVADDRRQGADRRQGGRKGGRRRSDQQDDDGVSVAELAKHCDMSPRFLLEEIKAGVLQAGLFGRVYRVHRKQADAYCVPRGYEPMSRGPVMELLALTDEQLNAEERAAVARLRLVRFVQRERRQL